MAWSPRVWVSNAGRLHARMPFSARLASLFSSDREVCIDPLRREVSIFKRSFCFGRARRIIPFDDIAHLDTRTDEAIYTQSFVAIIVLKDEREVPMMRFTESTSSGDEHIATSASVGFHGFLTLAREMIGITIGRPIQAIKDAQGRTYRCADCSRPAPPRRKKCNYCGGAIEEAPSAPPNPPRR